MHFLIAIVLLVSLCWPQVQSATVPHDWILQVAGTVLLALVAPLLSAAVIAMLRKHADATLASFRKRLRITVIAHSVIWAIASIYIIVGFRWADVVDQVPYADQIPLADDLLLIAPAMIGLVISWAIFIFGLPREVVSGQRSHVSLFVFWIRMQMTFVTAPILVAFFAADCCFLAQRVELSPVWQTLFWIGVGLACTLTTLFYPQLMLLFWPTKKVEDRALKSRISQWCLRSGLRPRKVLVWETGNAIVNAAAVGMVPGTEVILVSDMLLKKFDRNEVDAVVLHELGHVRHRHSLKRAAWILLPLIALGLDDSCGLGMHQSLLHFGQIVGHETLAKSLPAIAYLAYLLVVIRTVFRNMEFEADRFAIKQMAKFSDCPAIELALEKMAVIYPKTIDRQSGLHPSLRQRLAHADQVKADLSSSISPARTPALGPVSLDPIAAK